ncbi:unnamed protein product [Diplocarpon coronariae]
MKGEVGPILVRRELHLSSTSAYRADSTVPTCGRQQGSMTRSEGFARRSAFFVSWLRGSASSPVSLHQNPQVKSKFRKTGRLPRTPDSSVPEDYLTIVSQLLFSVRNPVAARITKRSACSAQAALIDAGRKQAAVLRTTAPYELQPACRLGPGRRDGYAHTCSPFEACVLREIVEIPRRLSHVQSLCRGGPTALARSGGARGV